MDSKRLKYFVKENWWFALLLAAVYGAGIYAIIYKPLLPEVQPLSKTFWLFGLSLQAAVILIWIGIYLLRRWVKGQEKNQTQLIWGASFLLYSIVFIGMMLQALGIPWANASRPDIFFWYRQFMIIWIAGMYYGVSRFVYRDRRYLQIVPTAAILLAGYGIFAYGLFQVKDIEYTMYTFLYLVFVPTLAILARLFWKYSSISGNSAPRYISIGFGGIALTYLAWAPWHKTTFYGVWFALYVLSLVPLLVGFLLIPREK